MFKSWRVGGSAAVEGAVEGLFASRAGGYVQGLSLARHANCSFETFAVLDVIMYVFVQGRSAWQLGRKEVPRWTVALQSIRS